MVLIALVGHLALAAIIFTRSPETSSGGGGKVLGTLSIALGGAPVDAQEPVDERPAEIEPAPQVEPLKTPVKAATPIEPKPRKTQVKPKTEPNKPVTSKALPKKSELPPPNPIPSAAPASAASNATPTLGEGAAAKKPGLGGGVESASDYDAYLAMLRARIEANRTYPASARRSGNEGVASVRLIIGPDGRLTQVSLVKSSGHFALDRAAKRMAQKAQPFPPPPRSTFDVTVPVVFALQ